MEDTAIDTAIELEAFGVAVEDRKFWRLVTARLVVAMVDFQAAFQLFERPVDGDDLIVAFGIEAQRVHLFHIDGEIVV